jgi:glycosyltransferase involved in cell wall biosynthesis
MEAMSTGADCIVSNASSLPEVYGESVWYIDPYDYENMNLDEIMSGEKKSNQLVLDKYSWKDSAEKLKEVLFKYLT